MGSHTRRDAAGRVTSTVVAIVSVVAIAAALVAFLLDGSSDNTEVASDEPSVASTTSAEPEDTSAEDTSAEAEPSDAESTAPKDKSQQRAKAEKKPKDKPTNKRTDQPEPEPVVPEVYVEVYNMTSVSGLAGSTAAQLQDAGWQVVGIDNWRGNIPASTVYYPSGLADEGTQLANTLGIGRVRGAVAPMKFDRLTVILTADAT